MRPFLLLLCLTFGPAAALAQTPAADPVLAVAAGLDGHYTSGRWVPVRVAAENRAADFSGELVVTWGATTYHQAISLPSPSKKRMEFYVRAADIRESLQVELHDDRGGVRNRYDVPIRGVLPAERLHVVVDAAEMRPESARAAFVRVDDLPVSWRGYDGVDEVEIASSSDRLTPAQAAAVARWRAVRNVDARDALRESARRDTQENPLDLARWQFLALYVGTLAVVLLVIPLVTRRTSVAHGAVAVLGIAFVAGAPAVGAFAFRGTGAREVRDVVATAQGIYITSLAIARPQWRGTTKIVSDLRESLLEAADAPPHDIVYDDLGGVALHVRGSLGETFSVLARGFGVAEARRD